MSYLQVKGANLFYKKVGKGPVFIFIPGANGTGDIFAGTARYLQDQYTVVTFDRRGYGHSELTEPLPEEAASPLSSYRVKTDADDVAALAKHLSDEPVYILGSSSGAIVAMETLQDHPDVVRKIAFHEPPINTFLSDSSKWIANNNQIIEIAQTEGMPAAMRLFGKTLNIAPIDAQMMAKPAVTIENGDHPVIKGMLFWFKFEIRQYTGRHIALEALAEQKDKIILFNGTDSVGSFPQEVVKDLSAKLDVPIHLIAGGHLGYAQKPQEFAQVLTTCFTESR
ncbi:pimeloyl-ACP methyl ester carboxylesterase [Paenibacillus shirakamiensis]|uniref:Pimeloyl-ACP methyl ester carboxylesterase n=1 Tax=Paenibacillus shirakamiensis TaxID=1265935 RepID=A0ABS4JEH3_9BACL|nr:alpha/beta fold hydrolase [Paenibacillus shirakamiensis]MBP2000117.1 pimeloyl-ACP methyl ester carboxylesterase [Paenibacillus shirakamiensis]